MTISDDEKHDCTNSVQEHQARVENWLDLFMHHLRMRADVHDASKLFEPEKSIFDRYTWRLQHTAFGSPEYQEQLAGMQDGLKHHYASNRHHPEHFADGIAGMNLIDLVEMFCDWKAAADRQGKPVDIARLIARFNIEPQLAAILYATVEALP